jgi:hypothetical protein
MFEAWDKGAEWEEGSRFKVIESEIPMKTASHFFLKAHCFGF